LEFGVSTGVFPWLPRQIAGTKSMESLNETNGIVERNQWNRSTKSMEWFLEIGGLVMFIWQIK